MLRRWFIACCFTAIAIVWGIPAEAQWNTETSGNLGWYVGGNWGGFALDIRQSFLAHEEQPEYYYYQAPSRHGPVLGVGGVVYGQYPDKINSALPYWIVGYKFRTEGARQCGTDCDYTEVCERGIRTYQFSADYLLSPFTVGGKLMAQALIAEMDLESAPGASGGLSIGLGLMALVTHPENSDERVFLLSIGIESGGFYIF